MPDFRSGILGIFQKAALKGLRFRRFLVFQDAGHHAGNCIDHHHGRKLPSGQHIIPDGNIICNDFLQHPLVNPLIMAAEKDQILLAGKLLGHLLGKNLSLRGHVDDAQTGQLSFFIRCVRNWCAFFCPPHGDPLLHGRTGIVNGLSLHQHARSASVWIIVHLFVFILRIVPDVHRFQFNTALFGRTSQNALRQPL